MKFLTIKKHQRPRKDGRDHAQAFVVWKERKFGPVISQQCISTTRPVLITGPNASGKTYWLERLMKDAARVWASREAQPLYLAATRPLAAWTDTRELELWWAGRGNQDDRHWRKLRAWERVDYLPVYLTETGAVLFVDDAHAISGRKLKILQQCTRAAKVWVMTAIDEGRLAPGLRHDVLSLEPQTIRLGTEVAYDATPILMWFLIAIFISLGYWEAAMAVGGLKMLGSGRRAAKQA